MKPRVLGIIPARGGSIRIPNKNKKLLNGKELVRYAIESALKSKRIDSLVLSTDDNEIIEIGKKYSDLLVLERPSELSGSTSLAIDYVNHALGVLDEEFDLIVIIQPTSPFTEYFDIDATIDLMEDKNADSAVSIEKLDHAIHPVKLKRFEEGVLLPLYEEEAGRMADFELPEVYVRNCSVYVSRRSTIDAGKIIGDCCLGYLMPRERSIDINDPIDFEIAEFLMTKYGK